MDKRIEYAQIRADLHELALLGNIWAKLELENEGIEKIVSLATLSPNTCSHLREYPSGRVLRTESSVTTQTKEGFEIKQIICTQCSKLRHLSIKKAN